MDTVAKVTKEIAPVLDEERKRYLVELILDTYGISYQKIKMAEELFELGTEVMHWMGGKTETMFVAQEVADVMIMCEQMRLYFKRVYGRDVVEEFIAMKLERTFKHLPKKSCDDCIEQPKEA